MHAFDGRTDGRTYGQTDRNPIAISRLHSMQRGKNGAQKQKFPIWKSRLSSSYTQYHKLQFLLKVVAICTDICMSLVQTVRSLLLPDFLSVNPVASICCRSRSSAEQDQSLSGNSSNNFLALNIYYYSALKL